MVTPTNHGGLEGPDITPASWDTTAKDLARHLDEGGELDAKTLDRLAAAAQDARGRGHGNPVTLYRWQDLPQPEPRPWLVTDWIPAGCLTQLSGAGGYGKSTLALQLAAAVASGAEGSDEWMVGAASDGLPLGNAVPHEGAPAVYACWEDDAEEIARRLAAISGPAAPWLKPHIDLHIAPLRGKGPLWESPGRFDVAGPTSLANQLQAAIAHLERPPALIILDSVAAIYSDNENDRRSVRAFLSWADRWAVDTGAGVLLVSHPPKSGADYSGSTDWLAGVRAMIKLDRQKQGPPPRGRAEDTRADAWKLESAKVSYAAQPAAVQLERTPAREGFSWQVAGPWDEAAEIESAQVPAPAINENGNGNGAHKGGIHGYQPFVLSLTTWPWQFPKTEEYAGREIPSESQLAAAIVQGGPWLHDAAIEYGNRLWAVLAADPATDTAGQPPKVLKEHLDLDVKHGGRPMDAGRGTSARLRHRRTGAPRRVELLRGRRNQVALPRPSSRPIQRIGGASRRPALPRRGPRRRFPAGRGGQLDGGNPPAPSPWYTGSGTPWKSGPAIRSLF